MRSLFALTMVVFLLAALPRVYAENTPSDAQAPVKKLTPTEQCHVDREECLETCTYHENDQDIPPCNHDCRIKYNCANLEHVNHKVRTLED